MDPTATLNRLIDAAVAGDPGEMSQAYWDLTGWLQAGGFPPDDPRRGKR